MTTTSYAILGILTHGPQSGYDIKKSISNSIGYFWQESYGQLYPALKSLVEKDYATMRVEKNEGKPDKKVYQLSDQGKEVLKDWLRQPVATVPKIRHELLLKLFFGGEIENEGCISHLEEYKKKSQDFLNQLYLVKDMIQKEYNDLPENKYWLLTVSNGIHCTAAEIAWCDESIKILGSVEN